MKLMASEKFFSFKDIFQIDICTLPNVMMSFEEKTSQFLILLFSPFSKKAIIACKFLAVPPSAFETVAWTIIKL